MDWHNKFLVPIQFYAHLCNLTHFNPPLPLVSLNMGDCGKVGRGNCAMEWPDGGTHNGTYNVVILEKGERSWAVRSYADVTREDVKTPLGQNRLIFY